MGRLTKTDIIKRDDAIIRLRVEERLSWRKIGAIMQVSHEWARKVFLRSIGYA